MEGQQPKKNVFTSILAILGTVLVCLTILAPIIVTVIFAFKERLFLFDYLMPAELFPFALAGGVLLFWAALRKRSRREWIGWSLGSGILMLVVSQLIAVLTGLANGESPPGGVWFIIVLIFLAGYILAVISLCVSGVLLLRDIFRSKIEPMGIPEAEG